MTELKQIIVSVDTEEEGLWGGNYLVTGNTTQNLRGLPRFQSHCERFSLPPTYLIDAPVLNDAQAMTDLRRWQDSQRCEVGTHCHPWCNPPLRPERPGSPETFLCNLPADVQYDKLNWLTQRVADAVGRAPTSFRAGRYGFGRSTAEILDQLGYQVDSSVLPLHEYQSGGGPDFRLAPRSPYRYFADDDQRELIEIPVTAGFTRAGYNRRRGLWTQLRKRPWRQLRLAGAADRLGIARRIKLTPEGTRLDDLKRLLDTCFKDGLKTLVLMLHSSSLVAGLSPYAASAEQLEELYKRLDGVLEHAVSRHGCRPATLTQAAAQLSGKVPAVS